MSDLFPLAKKTTLAGKLSPLASSIIDSRGKWHDLEQFLPDGVRFERDASKYTFTVMVVAEPKERV